MFTPEINRLTLLLERAIELKTQQSLNQYSSIPSQNQPLFHHKQRGDVITSQIQMERLGPVID